MSICLMQSEKQIIAGWVEAGDVVGWVEASDVAGWVEASDVAV